jgi:hypothetical protein
MRHLRNCQDLEKDLYDSFHVNFSSVIPRDLLEMMAQSTLQSGKFGKISQVRCGLGIIVADMIGI